MRHEGNADRPHVRRCDGCAERGGGAVGALLIEGVTYAKHGTLFRQARPRRGHGPQRRGGGQDPPQGRREGRHQRQQDCRTAQEFRDDRSFYYPFRVN